MKLFEWLEQCTKEDKKVIYITLGTMCKWSRWEIDAIYDGLKKLGVRAVWSLRGIEFPYKEDSDFWTSNWVPQTEVLAHPAIKAGLTHCGFGGSCDFIFNAKPIVTYPHFGDQWPNSENLCA